MIKRTLLRIAACLLFSAFTLFVLYYAAPMPNRVKNGFQRNFYPIQVEKLAQNELGKEISALSGIDNDNFYFAGTHPSWILRTDKNIKIIDTIWLGVNKTKMFVAPNTLVDSPNIYMYAGNVSTLIKGRFGKFSIDTIKLNTPVFTRSAQISPSTIILRGFDNTQMQQTFKKINCENGVILKESKIIKDTDLGISTDGYLKYDSYNNNLLYVQLYQNGIYCLDTNLNLIYKAKTIDTINQIEVPLENVQGKMMPKVPVNPINLECTINNDFLLVVSTLAADNESMNEFKSHYPIDIYKTRTGEYLKSFYIPKTQGQKIRNIRIDENRLIVLYEKGTVSIYKLPEELFI